jgi:hypothetical protein
VYYLDASHYKYHTGQEIMAFLGNHAKVLTFQAGANYMDFMINEITG